MLLFHNIYAIINIYIRKELIAMFKRLKCFLFYRGMRLFGRLIKDTAAKEEFYEFCSELWAEDGLF